MVVLLITLLGCCLFFCFLEDGVHDYTSFFSFAVKYLGQCTILVSISFDTICVVLGTIYRGEVGQEDAELAKLVILLVKY